MPVSYTHLDVYKRQIVNDGTVTGTKGVYHMSKKVVNEETKTRRSKLPILTLFRVIQMRKKIIV